ncbi:SGNH/GDSL hydrolase family protein [Rufibacter immobilis]|uniref:SGNH/GDSL hydrolase family protein n=1 Tax=Rufibacter immobilis TaxID=1348778 RepID=UPI0035E8C707
MLQRLLPFLFLVCLTLPACKTSAPAAQTPVLFEADHPYIQYTGRIDFSNPKAPRFWTPGVYITAKFRGTSCQILLNDEEYGGKHNYLEVIVDNGTPYRIQTTGKSNTIQVAHNLPPGEHTVTLCKNTESNIGYLELVGIKAEALLPPPAKPTRKIEFIGNSITCGSGADPSTVPCGQGQWHDQHNAYLAYGPRTARALNAQWHLTAFSGIGLMRSCCNMKLVMPQIFDKVNLRENEIAWNFSQYVPDAVTICLGQNDGIQDSTLFTRNYLQFLQTVRSKYPQAEIICLTSPMADVQLAASQKNYLTGIVQAARRAGDAKVHSFFFARSYTNGCDSHPNLADHDLIARELTPFLKKTLHW